MLFTTRSYCRKQTGRHFLFHNFVSFCRNTTFSQLNIECFIYFLAFTVIYTTFCTVQQIYYTQRNGKASSSLLCSVLFVQKYHAYSACNWLKIVNIVQKSNLQKVTKIDSNPRSMDRTASTLTIQPLRTLDVHAISRRYDLNRKL